MYAFSHRKQHYRKHTLAMSTSPCMNVFHFMSWYNCKCRNLSLLLLIKRKHWGELYLWHWRLQGLHSFETSTDTSFYHHSLSDKKVPSSQSLGTGTEVLAESHMKLHFPVTSAIPLHWSLVCWWKVVSDCLCITSWFKGFFSPFLHLLNCLYLNSWLFLLLILLFSPPPHQERGVEQTRGWCTLAGTTHYRLPNFNCLTWNAAWKELSSRLFLKLLQKQLSHFSLGNFSIFLLTVKSWKPGPWVPSVGLCLLISPRITTHLKEKGQANKMRAP